MRILKRAQIKKIALQIIAIQKMINKYDTASRAEQVEIFDKITEHLADMACEICGLSMAARMSDVMFDNTPRGGKLDD